MSRTLMAGIAAVIALVAIIWFFTSMQKAAAPVVTDVAPVDTGPKLPETPGTGVAVTIATSTPATATAPKVHTSLILEKGNYECLFTQSGTSGKSENVIHVSNGKMAATFRTFSSKGTDANNMVYDGRYLYVWDEGKTNGTRTELYKLEDFPTLIPKDLTSGLILGKGANAVGYDCHAWIVKPSMMSVPSNVKFN